MASRLAASLPGCGQAETRPAPTRGFGAFPSQRQEWLTRAAFHPAPLKHSREAGSLTLVREAGWASACDRTPPGAHRARNATPRRAPAKSGRNPPHRKGHPDLWVDADGTAITGRAEVRQLRHAVSRVGEESDAIRPGARAFETRTGGSSQAESLPPSRPSLGHPGRSGPVLGVTPSDACGLGRASLTPTPALPNGKAPPVRTAPCRCAPAPPPPSEVSAPSSPDPRKPHPRGRTQAQGPQSLGQ